MGLITDATDLAFEADGLKVTRSWVAKMLSPSPIPTSVSGIVLARPKAFPLERYEGRTTKIEHLDFSVSAGADDQDTRDCGGAKRRACTGRC